VQAIFSLVPKFKSLPPATILATKLEFCFIINGFSDMLHLGQRVDQ